jgi:hypothetical protein
MKCSLCDSEDVVFTLTFEDVCVAYCKAHYAANSNGDYVSVEVPFFCSWTPESEDAT